MQEVISFLKERQPVNLAIVCINVVVFLVLSIIGDTESGYFMLMHGAAYTPFILEYGEYYRLVTSMFLHFGIQHLFYNMLVLLFLGDTLEKIAGKWRYLTIYMLGGIIGNVASLMLDLFTEDYSVSAGASGAIFAVIGALVAVFILNRDRLSEYMGKRLLLMAGLSVLQGLTATGVDNAAHIGGMISGFLLALIFHRKFRNNDRLQELFRW